MVCKLSRIASWYCFGAVYLLTAPSFAVNLEWGSSAERFGIRTFAQVDELGVPISESTSGVPTDESAISFSEFFSPDIQVFVGGNISTDIKFDSPEALINLLDNQEAAIASVPQADTDFEGTLHAFSTTVDDFDLLNPLAIDWVIDVLPSPGETLGSPTLIRVETIVEGLLSATGSGLADASWLVVIDENTNLLVGSAGISNATLPFSDEATQNFVIPLGSSFQLRFLWELSISGSGVSTAEAEFTTASINISATVIPEPSTFTLIALALLSTSCRWRKRA